MKEAFLPPNFTKKLEDDDTLLESITVGQLARRILPNAEKFLKNSAAIGSLNIIDHPGKHTPEELLELAIKSGEVGEPLKTQLNTLYAKFKKQGSKDPTKDTIESWLRGNRAAYELLRKIGAEAVSAEQLAKAEPKVHPIASSAAELQYAALKK